MDVAAPGTEEDEEETLQTKAEPGAAATVSASVADRIHARRSGGEALSPESRSFFEPRFGRDFGRVRVHHDAADNVLAEFIGARAFTLGRDIFFGNGEFRPHSDQGKRLIAHELTHVVQQTGAASTDHVQRDLAIEPPHDEEMPRTLSPEDFNEALGKKVKPVNLPQKNKPKGGKKKPAAEKS